MTQDEIPAWTAPEIQKWVYPPQTKEDLDWADLIKIDLSKFDTPEGKKELVRDIRKALNEDGFWAVVNSGISQEEVSRQFSLGKAFFDTQSPEVKALRTCKFEEGDYFGYKRAFSKSVFGTDVKENYELINIPKYTANGYFDNILGKIPFVDYYQDEIKTFQKKVVGVAEKLLTLFALVLELPEDYFARQHRYDDYSDDHLRYMLHNTRPAAEDKKIENIWSRAHTDFGSLTLLFSQAVAGLQIRVSDPSSPDGFGWKYVRPVDGGIICNIGDALALWTNKYFKSTVHRVVRPPDDQVEKNRLGLIYFMRPGTNAKIELAPSPVLKREGYYKQVTPLTGQEWVRARVKNYHDTNDYSKRANETFKVGGFEVQDGFN